MEIQQSPLYAKYITALGWTVERVDGSYIYIRHFPIIGALAKIQRATRLPHLTNLLPVLKKHRVRTVAVEPDARVSQSAFTNWTNRFRLYINIKVYRSYFLPTKTTLINLTAKQEIIFQRFSEAKRRGVRRALKNNLMIEESSDIKTFIRLKNKSAGFLGFITTTGIDKLWQIFSPQHAAILLAYHNSPAPPLNIRGGKGGVIVAGILLLFWNKVAYYWIAAATREGKKSFAPTLLVWEALKLAKRRAMCQFDFLGVWDERMPEKNHEWLGFTKFKQGFGGRELYYPFA